MESTAYVKRYCETKITRFLTALNVEIKPELFSFSDAFCATRFVDIRFNIKVSELHSNQVILSSHLNKLSWKFEK